MDDATVIRIRGMQRLFNLRVTGYVDKPTWDKINEMRWTDAIQE